MRRIIGIIGALGVVVGFGGSVLAADLPPSPPPRAPAVYVPAVLPVYNWAGVYVGINGGWGWGSTKYTANAVGTFPGTTGSLSDNGGVVGGTLGANFQTGAFVFGVEGDWRAGYAADRVLFFATAGGAFANVQTNFNGTTTTHTQSGWTAGAGVEWAFADNWTAKVGISLCQSRQWQRELRDTRLLSVPA
jgi:outer membrane immunogenic protein